MQQRYFIMNMKSKKGIMIKYPKRGGLTTLDAFQFLNHLWTFCYKKEDIFFPKLRTMFRRYHNGISFLEVLFKVSKPHGMTYIGEQRFLVSLWSSRTFFVIDLHKKTIELTMLDKERQEVFSTYQHYDAEKNETYFATQLGKDELYKHVSEDIQFNLPIKIYKHNWDMNKSEVIWQGEFDTDAHYIALNKDKRYLALVQFGDFFDEDKNVVPSKIMIMDTNTKKVWRIDNSGWSPTAHIEWDPVEPDTCYFSCHNGLIMPVKSRIKFFFKKVYNWRIFGPASVHKYRITPDGPEKAGVFSHPDMIRMTIHKVFMHRGSRIIACTGFPNYLFFADADSMEFIKKIVISEKSGQDSVLGSLFPSPDGEKIYLITTKSFQIIDVFSGKTDLIYDLGKICDPFNHMTCVANSEW
jgi:hypothetical protein